MINRTPKGHWRVRVKSHGIVVADRTFELKARAESWEREQKTQLGDDSWVDPKNGKRSIADYALQWLQQRAGRVSSKTLQTDEYLLRLHTPLKFGAKPIGSVKETDVTDVLAQLMRKGLSMSSVVRYKATLSSMLSSAVEQRVIRRNPALTAKTPEGDGTDERHEVFPFSLEELRAVRNAQHARNSEQADITLFLGLTGLRWGELVALRVRDVYDLPFPSLRVSRSGPDGHVIRTKTKGGGPRTVPLVDELLPMVAMRAAGRSPGDLLFTAPEGGRISGNNWRRAVNWAGTSQNRRIHDLRHTAATLWLYSGIDIKTVQTWLGHASMTLTVDLYGHFMGTDANRAGVARLNLALGDATGTPGESSDDEGLANER